MLNHSNTLGTNSQKLHYTKTAVN